MSSQFLANLERLNVPRARYPCTKLILCRLNMCSDRGLQMKAVRSGAPCNHELLHFWGKIILIRTHICTVYCSTYTHIYIYIWDSSWIQFANIVCCSLLYQNNRLLKPARFFCSLCCLRFLISWVAPESFKTFWTALGASVEHGYWARMETQRSFMFQSEDILPLETLAKHSWST